jgi:hypothetical protein
VAHFFENLHETSGMGVSLFWRSNATRPSIPRGVLLRTPDVNLVAVVLVSVSSGTRLRREAPCTRRVPHFGVSIGFVGFAGTWNE